MSKVFEYYLDSSEFYLLVSRRAQVFIGSILVLPLCTFSQSFSSLRLLPYLSLSAISICVLTIFAAFMTDIVSHRSSNMSDGSSHVLSPSYGCWVLSFVIPFIYSFNQKAFTVYSTIKQRNPERWKYSIQRAVVAVSVFYVVFGIVGYYSTAVDSVTVSFNYLVNVTSLHYSDLLINIVRCVIFYSYPLFACFTD